MTDIQAERREMKGEENARRLDGLIGEKRRRKSANDCCVVEERAAFDEPNRVSVKEFSDERSTTRRPTLCGLQRMEQTAATGRGEIQRRGRKKETQEEKRVRVRGERAEAEERGRKWKGSDPRLSNSDKRGLRNPGGVREGKRGRGDHPER